MPSPLSTLHGTRSEGVEGSSSNSPIYWGFYRITKGLFAQCQAWASHSFNMVLTPTVCWALWKRKR